MDRIKIELYNNWSEIHNLPKNFLKKDEKKRNLESILFDEISYTVAGAKYIIQTRPGWDGKIHLLKKSTKTLPCRYMTGLTYKVFKTIKDYTGIIPEIHDNRIVPKKTLDLKWSDNFKLYNYQDDVVKNSLKRTRGIIEVSTGGGKTLIASRIVYELGVAPFLFYVLTRDLMYQSKERLEAAMPGLEVGIIGDGKCDIKDINIVTIQTASRVYGGDVLKDIKKSSDWDDDEISNLKNEDMSHVENKKIEIKKMIEEALGIYFDECLVGETQIIDKNGLPIKIENIKNNDQVLGGEVKNFFSKNVKEISKVVHSCGEIKCTNTHKHICISHESLSRNQREQRLKKPVEKYVCEKTTNKIKINDFLLMPTFIKHSPEKDNNLTFNQIRFIATIMGDGHIDKYGYRIKINIDKDRDWFREVFKEGLKDFGIQNYIDTLDSRGNLLLSVSDKKLNNFLVNEVGIKRGNKSSSIEINDFLWNNSLNSLEGFIDGILGSEGDISKNRVNISNSTSYKSICDIQLLLLKFGIVSNIQKGSDRKNIKHKTPYRLSVMGSDIQKLKKLKITMDRKKNKINNIKESNIDKRIVEYKGKKYYLSKIKEIEKTKGNFEVFDFTCDDHMFLANNILTHNCHHAAAKTCQDVIMKSKKSYYLFGGSATPIREDNADLMLEGVFGRKIGEISASFLIDKGFLIKPDIYFIKIKKEPERSANYNEDYLTHIVNNEERNDYIIKISDYLKSKKYSTLILVQRIDHGEKLEKLIEGSVFVHGGCNSSKRTDSLKKLESGEIPILIATSIADEGLDIPSLSALILAGGGKSKTRVKQRIGRVIRIDKKIKDIKKQRALVFDFYDTGRWVSKHAKDRFKILKTEPSFNLKKMEDFEAKIIPEINNLF